MIKNRYKITLVFILILCLMLITNYVHCPKPGMFSIPYNIMKIAIILAIVLLFYSQAKADIKK